jgi:hypothetical protein
MKKIAWPAFKTSNKALVIKMVVLQKDRHVDQWDKAECPEIDPKVDGELIFDIGAKTIQWRKDSLFNKLMK